MSYKIESPLPVIEGGTGIRAATVYAVLCGGTTTTDPFQPIVSVGTSGQILTSNGPGALPTFQTGVAGDVTELTGNSGGAVSALAGNINVVGDGTTITIMGNPGAHTLTASLVSTGAIQTLTGDAGGAISPSAGNINVIAGLSTLNSGSSVSFVGSGNTIELNVTDTNGNTIIGLDSGNATISGTNNTVLGKLSAAALTSGASNTIIGEGCGASLTTGANNILIGHSAGSSLATSDGLNVLIGHSGFSGAASLVVISRGNGGNPFLHNYPGSNSSTSNGGNLFIGANAGNFTLAGGAGNAGNDGIGAGALQSLTSGARNDAMGAFTLSKVTTGSDNVAIGSGAGFNSGANTGLVSGTLNVLVGYNAGNAYTSSESSNIVIGNVPGTAAESNVLRIGLSTGTGGGQLNQSFIAGIRGITPASADGIPVFIGSTGQLGTVGSGGSTFIGTLTGNTGGAESPLAGNFNVVGDGTTITIAGTANTLTASLVGTGAIQTLTGSTSGGAISPSAGNININAGTGITVIGTTNTLTIASNSTTAYTNVNTSPYVVLSTDSYLSVDSSGGAITVQLPNAATLGRTYEIKDRTGSAATHNITVTTVGGAVNIDGATTFVMNTAYESIAIMGNASTYEVF